ncbi:MAG: hypothetical protein WCS42_13815 [Verrucomicrobiota bacterium]
MKHLILVILAGFTLVASAQVPPPPAASQAEVNAGTVKGKYVSPFTLGSFVVQATNFPGIKVTNTAYASNFVATATGQTNVFDATVFTNGVYGNGGGLTNLITAGPVTGAAPTAWGNFTNSLWITNNAGKPFRVPVW